MANQATTARETERKYETDEHVGLADPFRLLGSAVETDPQSQDLSATYFDTADLRLLRAGITVLRRSGGHDPGWHLKIPVDVDTRTEIRLPLGEPEIPSEFRTLTRLPARGEPLIPVAQLDTTRRRLVLSDCDGRELAEIVADDVCGVVADSAAPPLRWREIEVELGSHGRRELLDRIEHELLGAGARRCTVPSKLARVLGARLDEMPTQPEQPVRVPAGSAGAVVLDYLRARAEVIRAADFGVRRDLPDAVHRMRVGCRELRSALKAFGRVLDRTATRPLVEELQWLGGELALARDTEVLAEQFRARVDDLPDELVLGEVRAQLARVMAGRSRAGRERASGALDSERYLRLHELIDAVLTDPPFTRRAGKPAAKELPRSVEKAFRRAAGRIESAIARAPGHEQDEALHEARKAAKRLRYATELAAPAVTGRTKPLRRQLRRMHKLLGAHQDAVVARPVLRALAADAQLHGANGFTFGLLHAEQSRRAEGSRREVPAAWARLARRFDRGPFRI